MIGHIYKYTSPSGKSYIGQTRQGVGRRADWTGKSYTRRQSAFSSAIKKHGFSNMKLEILYEIKSDNPDELIKELNRLEIDSIANHKTLYPNGYNHSLGGQVGAINPDTREKIRNSLLGKKHTPERRLNQSLARLGKEPWNKGKVGTKTPAMLEHQSKVGKVSTHKRWHSNRGIINPECVRF